MRLSRLPVQIQIALLVIGLIVSILALADVLSYLWLKAELRQVYQGDLRHDWGLAAEAVRDTVPRPQDLDRPEVQERLRHSLSLSPFPWAIIGTSGQTVSSEPLPAGVLDSQVRDDVIVVPGRGGARIWAFDQELSLSEAGAVRFVLWTTDEATNQALTQKLQRDLVILALILMLVIPFSLWMARRILAPVRRISDVARSIDASALHERLPERVVQDDLGHLTQTLNALFQRIEDSVRGTQAFTGNAAHQLRTPLSVLKIEVENAIDRAAREPQSFDALVFMAGLQSQIQRLIHLANNLMLISESDAQGVPLTPEQLRLEELVAETVELAAPLADAHGITVSCVRAAGTTWVSADPTKLGLALMNLVDNGIRYTPRGGRVSLEIAVGEEEVSVRVGGSGPPIAEEDRERIFERFYRGPRSTGGGLGLAIARSVVRAHGGSLSLVDGNVFEIRLATAQPADAACPSVGPARP